MAKLSPMFNEPWLDANGDPYSGAQLFTYTAGSSTKQATYKDKDSNTAHANPIVLNSRGIPDDPIWLTEGETYKFVLAPSGDTDPPASAIDSWDDLEGINDASISVDEWTSGPTPTYVSATSFTLVGDQSSTFHVGRRLKTTNTGGTVYSTITAVAYTSLTTVTVSNDSGSLDSGLSAVSYGLVAANNGSIPPGWERVSRTSVSSASSADIEDASLFDGTYSQIKIVIESLVPATDDVDLRLRVKIGGSYQTGSNYEYHAEQSTSGASTYAGDSSTGTTAMELATTVGNAAGESLNGEVMVYDPSNTSFYKMIQSRCIHVNSSTNLRIGNSWCAYTGSTGALQGIRFVMSSGNISAATITAYGLRA